MLTFWCTYVCIQNKYYNEIKESLKEFHDKYIITYVDKGNTNYTIIFKSLYRQILKEAYSNDMNCQILNSSKQIIGNM